MVCRKMVTLLGLAGLLAVAGCGDDSSNGKNDGGYDGCVGGARLLSVVGNPNRVLHPGDQEKLQVVFLEQCKGAVAGETVSFEIIGNPGDSSLDATQMTTQPNGLAFVNLFAGTRTGQFQVRAHHPDDPNGVYFSINLKPVLRQLAPVGPTSLECYVNETVEMQVKLVDLDDNSPVRGAAISFSVVQPAPGDGSVPSPQATTNVSGVAANLFHGGTTPVSYQVTAEGATEQVGTVTFDIRVKQRQECITSDDCPNGFVCVNGACRQSGGEDCVTDDQCPDGYECKDGFCRPEGALPDSCDTSDDCPQGYYCEGHECYPCPEVSDRPECQGGGEGCETDNDCPPGFVCRNGVCYPDNDPETPIPELGGTWYVAHYFDMSDSLGGASVQEILDILNEAINYCEITGIGFIDDLICDLIDDYVPDWVGTLIDIMANLTNMMSELRAEGEMELNHLNPRELVSGTESWETILVRYLHACCDCNGEPGNCCNPYNQPDFPDCATIDISREELDFGDVGIEVLPFTGKIQVDDSGPIPAYTLLIDPRQVKMEYSKFVAFLVDLLIQIFTGYDNLDEALMDIIDCQAIQDLVDDIAGSWAPNIVQACEDFKPGAGELLRGLLNQIGVGWKLLKFTGWATITTDGDDPPYGIQLGFKQQDSSSNRHCDGYCAGACSQCDGNWNGDVNIVIDGDLKGGWFGER